MSTNSAAKATCMVIANSMLLTQAHHVMKHLPILVRSVKLLPGPNYPWVCVFAAMNQLLVV